MIKVMVKEIIIRTTTFGSPSFWFKRFQCGKWNVFHQVYLLIKENRVLNL